MQFVSYVRDHATKQNISLHIANIYKEGELDRYSVVKEYLTTASDGKCYRTKWFNLDVIISVGYRIKSIPGNYRRILYELDTQLIQDYLLQFPKSNMISRALQLEVF